MGIAAGTVKYKSPQKSEFSVIFFVDINGRTELLRRSEKQSVRRRVFPSERGRPMRVQAARKYFLDGKLFQVSATSPLKKSTRNIFQEEISRMLIPRGGNGGRRWRGVESRGLGVAQAWRGALFRAKGQDSGRH